MSVDVHIPTVFLAHTNGARHVPATGRTVAEVLRDLESRHPDLGRHLLAEDGHLRRFVNIFVNDTDVRSIDMLDTELADGDSVMILPAVAGG
jgi:MoaD family protein